MGWIQKCCKTYDNNLDKIGKLDGDKEPLCPFYFMMQKVQLELTITEDGEFASANVIDEKIPTLIPVTEKSASRCGKDPVPHPLCDKIEYCALGNEKYPDYKKFVDKYKGFMTGLKAWAESEYSHFIVKAVYKYCNSGTLVSDLTKSGIIECDENGLIMPKKISGVDPEDAFIRWRVLSRKYDGGESWTDSTLFESYKLYYESREANTRKDICYASGKNCVVSEMHAKGIVKFANGAKLVSANDNTNFTYRGRFGNASEAYALGAEASQKAHKALRWLISNFGGISGGRVFVCWNAEGANVPNILNTEDAFIDAFDQELCAQTTSFDSYKNDLRRAINGYRTEFENLKQDKSVTVMSLDAATTGRLSITYYNEIDSKDFFDNLQKWNESCCWYKKRFSKDKKPYLAFGTPSPYQIVRYALGTQRGDFVEADANAIKNPIQSLITSVVCGKPIQSNIVSALFRRASMRTAYSDNSYETLLYITCAMIRKYINDKKQREEITLELDKTNSNRSYLFGRLLAVAEKVEGSTYTGSDTGRETNAIRLQAAFTQRPMRTWAILEKALIPYYSKLNYGLRKYYKDMQGEILTAIQNDNQNQLNLPLKEEYLIGYYLQRKELNTYNKKQNNSETEEE